MKHTQHSAVDAIDKLKDSTNLTKSLETECNNLKELLNKCQSNQRNLNTTCLILIEMLNATIKQKNILIEHKNLFDSISKKWFKLQTKLHLTLNDDSTINKNSKDSKIYNLSKKHSIKNDQIIENLKNDNLDLIDYSISSSILSSSSSSSSAIDSFLNLSDKEEIDNTNNKTYPSKLCLFRRITIAIIAVNRLNMMLKNNKNSKFSKNSNENNIFKFMASKSKQKFNEINNSANTQSNNLIKNIIEWLTLPNENNIYLKQLLDISNDLNGYLFNEDGINFEV